MCQFVVYCKRHKACLKLVEVLVQVVRVGSRGIDEFHVMWWSGEGCCWIRSPETVGCGENGLALCTLGQTRGRNDGTSI